MSSFIMHSIIFKPPPSLFLFFLCSVIICQVSSNRTGSSQDTLSWGIYYQGDDFQITKIITSSSLGLAVTIPTYLHKAHLLILPLTQQSCSETLSPLYRLYVRETNVYIFVNYVYILACYKSGKSKVRKPKCVNSISNYRTLRQICSHSHYMTR